MAAGHVIIVGGGVIGLASAWRLRQAGADVTLVERGELGAAASHAAAGMLAPQMEASGPGPMLELCLRARAGYRAFVDELRHEVGLDTGFREDGALQLALSGEELQRLEALVTWQRGAGLAAEWLKGRALRELEPALSDGLDVGAYFPGEGQVDNRKLTRALVEVCTRHGVRLVRRGVRGLRRDGARVGGVELEDATSPEGDLVVLAAGAWSSLLPDLLPTETVQPVRGQMLAYTLRAPLFRRLLSTHGGYLVPREDGRVLVGSTMERCGFEPRVTPEGMRALERLAGTLVPALRAHTPTERWAGLRPATADGLPLLGRGPYGNLVLATGHFRNGILLADVTARLVVELAQGATPPKWLAPFGFDRLQAPPVA